MGLICSFIFKISSKVNVYSVDEFDQAMWYILIELICFVLKNELKISLFKTNL